MELNLKYFILKWYLRPYNRSIPDRKQQLKEQNICFTDLMGTFVNTEFGRLNLKGKIPDQKEFAHFRIYDYADTEPFIKSWAEGIDDVLWKGKPLCFAISSGTTGKTKFIPITKDSLKNQRKGPQRYMAHIVHNQGRRDLLKKKILVLTDAPHGMKFGKFRADSLSALLSNSLDTWMSKFVLPSPSVQKETDLNKKLKMIAHETVKNEISCIIAMPAWLNVLLDECAKIDAKQSFSNLDLVSFSGMDPHPYIPFLEKKMDRKFTWYQSYPASEGFFAYSVGSSSDSMLLITDQGIYYEFIEARHLESRGPKLLLEQVVTDTEYAMIITSNNGLFSYLLGDVIVFTDLDPFMIRITGRVSDQLSVAGEQLSIDQIDKMMGKLWKEEPLLDVEIFLVHPEQDGNGTPFHHWHLEANRPEMINTHLIQNRIDQMLKSANQNYEDCRKGSILNAPSVTIHESGEMKEKFLRTAKRSLQSKLRKIYTEKPLFLQ